MPGRCASVPDHLERRTEMLEPTRNPSAAAETLNTRGGVRDTAAPTSSDWSTK